MPQVICPACQAVYDIPIVTLGGAGRKLRCAECKTLFLATGPDIEPATDAALVDAARQRAEAEPAEHQEILVAEPAMEAAAPSRVPWQMRIGARQDSSGAHISPIVLALMVMALIGTFIGVRKSVVAAVPETAALYAALQMPVNLRGLELRDVKSGVFSENSSDVLVVQGEIANVTAKKQIVPPLAFTVRDAKGGAVYSWTASTDVSTLEPGAKATFRRRLASPPAEGVDVLVRFAGKPGETLPAH
jgi:predicted Zn finger-like uncharacterized protein